MNKFSKILIIGSGIIMVFNFVVLEIDVANAADVEISCGSGSSSSSYNQYPWCKDKPQSIGGLVNQFYNYALALVGVAALAVIIYGGILWTISAGDPGKIKEAKEWIMGAIYGLLLLISASLLFRTINSDLVNLKGPEINAVLICDSGFVQCKDGESESGCTPRLSSDEKKTIYCKPIPSGAYIDYEKKDSSSCRQNVNCTWEGNSKECHCLSKTKPANLIKKDCVADPTICGSDMKCDTNTKRCVPKPK